MVSVANAELVLRSKTVAHGGIVEMVIWKVSLPVPPSTHPYKYRLVFVKSGHRLVGYDNERGKGDHRHVGDRELPYSFVDIDMLLQDFLSDVEVCP